MVDDMHDLFDDVTRRQDVAHIDVERLVDHGLRQRRSRRMVAGGASVLALVSLVALAVMPESPSPAPPVIDEAPDTAPSPSATEVTEPGPVPAANLSDGAYPSPVVEGRVVHGASQGPVTLPARPGVTPLPERLVRPAFPDGERPVQLSPDGSRLVFQEILDVSRSDPADDRYVPLIYVIDLDDGSEHLVAEGGAHPTWLADGRLAYVRVEGQPEATRRGEPLIGHVIVGDGTSTSGDRWTTTPGRYQLAGAAGDSLLIERLPHPGDPTVEPTVLIAESRDTIIETPGHVVAVSPDGHQIVVVRSSGGGRELALVETATGRDVGAREVDALRLGTPRGDWVGDRLVFATGIDIVVAPIVGDRLGTPTTFPANVDGEEFFAYDAVLDAAGGTITALGLRDDQDLEHVRLRCGLDGTCVGDPVDGALITVASPTRPRTAAEPPPAGTPTASDTGLACEREPRDAPEAAVFYLCVDGDPRPVERDVEGLEEAVAVWAQGPTPEETDRGLSAAVSPELVAGVDVDGATATVTFAEELVTGTSGFDTSTASMSVIRSIQATVFASAPEVDQLRLTIEGDCDRFWGAAQTGPCRLLHRDGENDPYEPPA